ncbi:hypothetical protein PV10_07472 [Exophiala mesophila]|uniref:Uncharacterized protein n=1 Tax=Exophiala mesophila TaxID=212818 RepID=A0A0D1XPU9_EXOME|nr:uncharacterized protein PV10_07472 [Exophiala mesophila]KIV90131.1 hypothetical protein PV10_07472 [Exophiala mesophila]
MLFTFVKSIASQHLRAFIKKFSGSWDRPVDRCYLKTAASSKDDSLDPIGAIYDHLGLFQEHQRWHRCKEMMCPYAPDPVRGILSVLGVLRLEDIDDFVENFLCRIPEDDMRRLVDGFRDYHEGISEILRTSKLPDENKSSEENFLEVMALAFSEGGHKIFWSPLPHIYRSLLKVLSAGKESYLDDLRPGIKIRNQGAFGVTNAGCRAMRKVIQSELGMFLEFLYDYGDLILRIWDLSKIAIDRFIYENPGIIGDQPDSGRSQQPSGASSRDSHGPDSRQSTMYEPREEPRRDSSREPSSRSSETGRRQLSLTDRRR